MIATVHLEATRIGDSGAHGQPNPGDTVNYGIVVLK